MKSSEAKKNFIKLLQDSLNKPSEEIGKIFRLASRQKKEYTNLEIYWNSSGYNEYNKYENINGEEGFKFAHCVGAWRTSYFYCTSNLGRLLVVNLKDEKIKKAYKNNNSDTFLKFNIELNKKNCELIKIEKGFIVNKNTNKFNDWLSLANTKNIYEFVRDSGWLENDKSKELAIKFNDTIEIHHINNCANDNRIDNLIYLPKSIHRYSH